MSKRTIKLAIPTLLVRSLWPVLATFPCHAAQAQATQVSAPEPAPVAEPIQTVVVSDTRSAENERRNETTTRIVVKQAELVRYGDNSLSDALRRLPGITIGEGEGGASEVRMRGLGSGYTQVLLNGEAPPGNFSIDSISPGLIERVEIMRAASAEYGTKGIAGTINIILKKAVPKAQRDVTLGLARSGGGLAPNLALNVSDRYESMSYVVAGTVGRTRSQNSVSTDNIVSDAAGNVQWQRHTQENYLLQNDTFSLAPRLTWSLAGGDKLTSQSFFNAGRVSKRSVATEQASVGQTSDFPVSVIDWDSNVAGVKSSLTWLHNLEGGGKLEVTGGVNRVRRVTDFYFGGFDSERTLLEVHDVSRGHTEKGFDLSGKYHAPMIENHVLVIGWSGSSLARSEYRNERESDGGGAAIGGSDHRYRSSVRNLALFVQDEWQLTPDLSANAGVRWEGMATTGGIDALPDIRVRSSVASPLLQVVWKRPEKKQWRFAVGRTYNPPTTVSLVPNWVRVDSFNRPFNPDTQGNPNLRPELAWGLDGAFEQYFGDSGFFSVSMFARRIDGVILTHLTREDGRWLALPRNDGNAQSRGIEVEANVALPALIKNAPNIEVRANLVRAWSSVDNVPGPDNRLVDQTPFSMNLGLDYRPNGVLTMGASYSYQSGGATRRSAYLDAHVSPSRELDFYALWKVAAKTKLRLAFANVLQQRRLSETSFIDIEGRQAEAVRTRPNRVIRAVVEHSF